MDETLQTASGTEDVQQLLLDGADYPRSWREMFDSLVKSSTFADEHWGRQPFVHTFEKQAQNSSLEFFSSSDIQRATESSTDGALLSMDNIKVSCSRGTEQRACRFVHQRALYSRTFYHTHSWWSVRCSKVNTA
jgi:hypothetical protein